MKFEINFLDLPTTDRPDLEVYGKALLSFDETQWYDRSTGGAGFVAQESGSPAWSLVLIPQRGRGISLLATVQHAGRSFGIELTSVGDAASMNDFIATGQDVVVPVGSFVAPQQALWAIEDFCANPRVASPRVRWQPTDELEYPVP